MTRSAALLRSTVVVAAGFVLGGATSWAQGVLPAPVSSTVNSASGWVLPVVALVAWSRVRAPAAAVLAAGSLVLLVLGYTTVSELRGLHYDPRLFGGIGIVVGPVIGSATAWLRSDGVRAAAGTAVICGIVLGESAYGLTVLTTTSAIGWIAIGLAGLVLLVAMLVRRLQGRWATAAVAGTAVVAAVFFVAYQALGSV